MGNQGKKKNKMAASCSWQCSRNWTVLELSAAFRSWKEKLTIKSSNIVLWRKLVIILILTSAEKSFHPLFEGTTWNFRGERGICDYGKTLGGFPWSFHWNTRFYLQQGALTCYGTHADLAALALVAFEQNLPIKEIAETLLCTLQREYSSIFSFFLFFYKFRKALSFYKSGFVYNVYVKTINTEGVLLKAAVTPSQRIWAESHKVWVLIKLSGEVVSGFCSIYSWLQQGLQSCHCTTLQIKVEFAEEHRFLYPSCTERACFWTNSSNKGIQPKRVQDMVIVDHVRPNATLKFTVNNNTKRSSDPRPFAQRCVSEECKHVSFLK